MENVKLWQYVVIVGAGALAGILAAVALMREERAAMLRMVEDESLRAFQEGWKACEKWPFKASTKEIAKKFLEVA